MQSRNARGEFTRLNGLRSALKTRLERYAAYTLPRLMLPGGQDEINSEISHDFQAVGAQGTNHLCNRLMLTMFAPSRPFMRLTMTAKDIAELGIPPEEVEATLAEGEQNAVREMDNVPGFRADLFTVMQNLVVLGNVALHLPKKGEPTVYALDDYVIRRTPSGKVKHAIVRETVKFDELEDKVRESFLKVNKTKRQPDSEVTVYHSIERIKGKLIETTWVDDTELPESDFKGEYTDADCPWHFLVWNLSPRAHYGTGLVEDYAGDFAALSALSKAQVDGAILASEFRWLANPTGQTRPEEFESSENGAVLAGVEGDLSLVNNSKPGDLQVVRAIGEDYIRRIGQGFLLNSAMTRDAERVTAEEIRQQAQELETGLGGVYTRLASTLQRAVAMWLLHKVDIQVKGTKINVQIVTGLDALSRNGDLAALRAALNDIALLEPLTQSAVGQELNFRAIINAILAGHGVPGSKYLASAEEKQARQAQANAQAAAQAGTEAAAQQIARQQ